MQKDAASFGDRGKTFCRVYHDPVVCTHGVSACESARLYVCVCVPVYVCRVIKVVCSGQNFFSNRFMSTIILSGIKS